MAPNPKKGGKTAPLAPIKDTRFAHVHRDPRFRRPQKSDSKVTVDSRFSSMLKGKEFSSAPKVDKYGRKLQSSASDRQMKRFYQLQKGEVGSDEEESDDDEDQDEEDEDVGVSGSDSESEVENEDAYDPMRGRGVISGSDSDSDIDEEVAAELDAEAEAHEDEEEEEEEDDVPRGDESHRFACVNLDWDHVKSIDLFKVFSGFKPEKGAIRSVKIYPSEFGKERMEREEREGPPPEIFQKASASKNKDDEDEDEDEEDEEIDEKTLIRNQTDEGNEQVDSEALRRYQLDRLKYYYAVVDCDSVETAKAICEACDGAEYESSANFFDLRYIPDGMEFDDMPRDSAFGAPENYKPNDFITQAFQHSNVKLTWDEDDADRIKVTRQKFSKKDLEDMDFKAYLASSDDDSEDEDDIEATKRRYRALLEGGNKDSDDSDVDSDDDKNQEMEITFAPGLSEAAAELLEAKKQRELPVKEETSIEAYKRKEKERKQRKKDARASKFKGSDESDDDSDDQGGEALFSEDEDERLMNDSYFAEEFAGGDMAPAGKGKKGESKKKSKNEKKKRTKEERIEDNRKKAELELLMEDNRENNQHFNMKEIQKVEKKNKRKKNKSKGQSDKEKGEDLQDNFKIDVSDPRFSALHESHHFALDPTSPHFKKTKAMTELLQERQKRTAVMHEETEQSLKKRQQQSNNDKKKNNQDHSKIKVQGAFEDPSLSLLVDTVKRKSAMATESSRDGKRTKKNK